MKDKSLTRMFSNGFKIKKYQPKKESHWFMSTGYNGNIVFTLPIKKVKEELKKYKNKEQVVIKFPVEIQNKLERFNELEQDNILLKDVIRNLINRED